MPVLTQRYHREFFPVDMKGCVLYLPFWRYGAQSQKIWDQSGNHNDGTITGSVPYPGNPQRTSVGSTFNRGDFTAINAFFWSSLDLSPYAGTDLGSTPYYIEVLDGAGKKATGYLAGVGAGETLGSELVVDPGFLDHTKWTALAGWAVPDTGFGVATNSENELYQHCNIHVVGGLYKQQGDFVVTSGIAALRIGAHNSSNIISTGSYSDYWITNSSYQDISIIGIDHFTGTITNRSNKRVTDPPTTAVHIVSSLNGTVRAWESVESGFDPNTIASWKINSVIPATCIGWYFDDIDDLVAHPSINFGNTHTLLYWFRSFANAKNIIHGGAANYHVAIDGTNLYYNAGATELSQAHGGGISNPMIIGIVRSGTTVQFFKNGVQIGANQTLDANNDLTLTTIGSYDTPGTFFGGVMLENEGFTRVFSAQEIKSYYEMTRSRYG